MSHLKAIRLSSTLLARSASLTLTNCLFRVPLAQIHSPHITNSTIHARCLQSNYGSSNSVVATAKSCDFTYIENHLKDPSPSRILIDVREAKELHDSGTIPGSLNIPFISAPDAFILSPSEFRDRFGFSRPEKDVELVFYCRSGVRSSKAADLALKAGWLCVVNYSGSWLDWEERGGKKQTYR
ncbi:putative thiosulfate sulfurtransferase, mitochondrial [Golovinomyces cichoracearum]|uniref:Putative thiosulfate sulfurtransferase, mitochondrial n=1 Tax=Golovinomyces cichoracearum TaxID=62708 RepID=A0A420I570_9PEZI|nr:putative thiosulfate sulfurtransferase, mitochondrial [Golovinomyces cichoracearum]